MKYINHKIYLHHKMPAVIIMLLMMTLAGSMDVWAQSNEKVLYSTDFQDWDESFPQVPAIPINKKTIDGQDLIFYMNNVTCDPSGTDAKFTGTNVTVGYLRGEKAENANSPNKSYIETSTLKSVTSITFVQAATGGKDKRGWRVQVQEEGQSTWTDVFKTPIHDTSGETDTININKTNVKIRFVNILYDQFAFFTSLEIKGEVDPVDKAVVSYYDTDGTTLIGSQTLSKDDTEEGYLKLKYQYGKEDVSIGQGQVFRGWFNGTGESAQKVTEGAEIYTDMSLYAKATDKETTTEGSEYQYDLSKINWYQEDHENITITGGAYYNRHGWRMQKNGTIKLQVGSQAKVTITLCNQESKGNITVTDADGNQLGSFSALALSDGATETITWEGGYSTTLTFSFSDAANIHSLEVLNFVPVYVSFKFPTNKIEGECPAIHRANGKNMVEMPSNALFVRKGWTFKGWTDGTNLYEAGKEYTFNENTTLTPRMTENQYDITDTNQPIDVVWNLDYRKAPAMSANKSATKIIYTTSTTVEGEQQDAGLGIDASIGRIENTDKRYNSLSNYAEGALVGNGTVFTVPAVYGMVVKIHASDKVDMENGNITTHFGDTYNDANITATDSLHAKKEVLDNGKTLQFTYTGDETAFDFTVVKAANEANTVGFIKDITVTYPVLPNVVTENVITNKDPLNFPNEKEKNAGDAEVKTTSVYTNVGKRFKIGDKVTVVATPSYGYTVTGYRLKGSTTPLTTTTVAGDKAGETLLATEYIVTDGITTIEAMYQRKEMYKVTAKTAGKKLGSVSLSPIYDNFYSTTYQEDPDDRVDLEEYVECWYTEGTQVTTSSETTAGYIVDYWTEGEGTDPISHDNAYTFTVGKQGKTLIVHIKEGIKGTVIFDTSDAHVNGASVAEANGGCISQAIETQRDVRYFTVPSSCTLFKSIDENDNATENGYTLMYWMDKDDPNNKFELGKTYSFKKEQITLIPYYQANPATQYNRLNNPVIHFELGREPQDYLDPMLVQVYKVSAQAINIGSNQQVYWTTNAEMQVLEGSQVIEYTRDFNIWCDTGKNGYIRNTDQDNWCAIGEGTILNCPSSAGAKVSILTYSKITTTTIGGVVPTLDEARTLIERAKAKSDKIYVYSYTTNSSALRMPIVIGDDYTYYKWIEVSLQAANMVNLNTSVDDAQHGSVTHIESLSTYGAAEQEDGSYSFRQGDRVRMTFKRNFGYEFDKIVDLDRTDNQGNPIVVLEMREDGRVNMVDENYNTLIVDQNADGTWGTAEGSNKTKLTLQAKEPSAEEAQKGERTTYTVEFDITTHRRVEIIFKEKPTYYVTYNPGKFATGIAPVAQWVEKGDDFTIPKNQSLYYEGNTLDYWVDGEYTDDMSENEKAQHIYHVDHAYKAPGYDLRLYPVFSPNSFNILDVDKEQTVTWHFAQNDGALEINYEGTAGILVSQLYNGDKRIDLKLDLDAKKNKDGTGKFNNTSNGDRVQINKASNIYFPSTANCVVTLTAVNNQANTVTVAGKTEKNDKKNGYTTAADKKSIQVVCSGDSAYQVANFTATVYTVDFAVTYKPQQITKPTIQTLTCDGTTYSAEEIKQQMEKDGYVSFSVSPWNNDKETIPTVTGTATENGTVEVSTTATVLTPEATAVVKTKSGIAVETYPIHFTFTSPDNTPHIESVKVNGKDYQDQSNLVIDDAPQNGTIVVRFDRTMSASTINQSNPQFESNGEAGRSLTFKYRNLTQGESYTFSFSPNTEMHFTDIYNKVCEETLTLTLHVMKEQSGYQHIPFDFVVGVDGNMDEAIAAANSNTKEANQRYYIFVPDGEYQLTGNEPIAGLGGINNGVTIINKPNVSLIGQSKDGVTIWNEPKKEGLTYTGTIHMGRNATDFYAQDLTLENRFDYWGGSTGGAGRAAAFWDQGNRNVLKNVALKSWQDTYFSNNGNEDYRGYFENCDFYGIVDFLCGDGNIWLEQCNIILRDRSGNNICAPTQKPNQSWGYVFNNCIIKPETENPLLLKGNDWTLARPWGDSPCCTFLNTRMLTQPRTAGWQKMTVGLVIRFHEYRSMDADDNLITLGTRSLSQCSPGAGSDDCVLSDAQADEYTIQNVMSGTDAFEPDVLCIQIDAKTARSTEKSAGSYIWDDHLYLDDNNLEWTPDPRALCYFLFKEENGKWVYKTNTAESNIGLLQFGSGTYCVRAANQRGGLGAPTTPIEYEVQDPYDLTIKQTGNLTGDDGKPCGWTTICLPFNAKVPEGITVYAATAHGKESEEDKVSDYLMTMTPVKVIDAEKGYVVYGPVGTYSFMATSRECEHQTILSGNPMDEPISTVNQEGYVLAYRTWGLGFYKFTGSTYAPYRAWLPINMVTDNVQEGLSTMAQRISLVFADDATAIRLPSIPEAEEQDTYYNLSGQKIPTPSAPGIYIERGKGKVVKK